MSLRRGRAGQPENSMGRPSHLAALWAALLACAPIAAAQPETDEEPPIPPKIQDEAPPGPEVTIRRERERVVTEYRQNGRLYMVRVVPRNAPPYVLVDVDGDGELETSRYELAPGFLVPHWVLFRW